MTHLRLWRRNVALNPEIPARLRRWLVAAVILGLVFVCLALATATWLMLTVGLYQYPNAKSAGLPNFF